MPITFIKNDNVFTLQDGGTALALNTTDLYMIYDDATPGTLTTSTTPPPAESELFSYSTSTESFDGGDIVFDVYDFKNNTMLFDGFSVIGLFGMVEFDDTYVRNVFFKNLTFKIEDEYPLIQGFFMMSKTFGTTFDAVVFVENCHILCEADTVLTVSPLVGDYFQNGIITKCSMDYVAGSEVPMISSGGICGDRLGYSTIAGKDNYVSITYCYSTGNISTPSGGGISGSGFGNSNTSTSVCNTDVISCYSTGIIDGTNAGGICGGGSGYSNAVGASSVSNITSCYSIGEISGDGAGGIIGNDLGSSDGGTTIFNITSCYSTGVVSHVDAGGIIGSGFSSQGVSDIAIVVIDCCYTLDGIEPVTDLATGDLLGTSANTSATITVTDSSFGVVVSGGVDITGQVTITVLLANCADYTEYRCAYDGQAPILGVFLVCDDWQIDSRCLENFSPGLGPCTCPLETSEGVEWPLTQPGTVVTKDCVDNVILSRSCNILGSWESVQSKSCKSGPKLSNQAIAGIIVSSIIGAMFILFIVFMVM